MEIEYAGLIGLYGGAIIGAAAWYFGRRKGKKDNSIDEMHNYIMKTARSFSWFLTLATIYILFTLDSIGIAPRIPAVLGIIMLVQLASWGISAAFLSYYMSIGKEVNVNAVIGILIIFISAVLFIIIAVITKNWIFLFWPIPFGIIGVYFMKYESHTEGGG